MPALSLTERKKLAAICARLSSDADGEVLAAAHKAGEFLRAHGLSWDDVLHAAPPEAVTITNDRTWQHVAEQIHGEHLHALTDYEIGFVQSIIRRGRKLTPPQSAVLRSLVEKTGVAGWQS
jgi:hypothetical protein